MLAAAWIGGCAHAVPPPGGVEDREPPRVISTTPEQMAVVEPSRDAVVFRFDERISERGLQAPVLVSPETGEVEVSRGRREIRVRLKNGWQPGLVYQVTLLPVVQDLFGNVMPEPVVLVFSTGAEIPNTVVAGVAVDRLTGRPVSKNLRVEATRLPDSTRYVAVGDTAGFFALRHLPPGEYRLVTYQDGNRNRRLDFSEPMFGGAIEIRAADTTLVELPLLAQDTTPARLTRAEVQDSVTVMLRFDDAIDPELRLVDLRVRVFELPDSTLVPINAVLHRHEYDEMVRTARREAPEAGAQAGEDAPPDAPPDSAAAGARPIPRAGPDRRGGPDLRGPRALPGGAGARPEQGRSPEPARVAEDSAAAPLPSQELVVLMANVLKPDTRYRVEVEGLTNLAGLEGGGGSVAFTTPKVAARDTAAAQDTAAAPPDTTIVPPRDSTVVPPDTVPPGAKDLSLLPVGEAGANPGSRKGRPEQVEWGVVRARILGRVETGALRRSRGAQGLRRAQRQAQRRG